MNGYARKNNNTGGGFAAERPVVPEASRTPESPSESSQREKTNGVRVPNRIGTLQQTGTWIKNRGIHHNYYEGWNDCLRIIRLANPDVNFTILADYFDPKYWKII